MFIPQGGPSWDYVSGLFALSVVFDLTHLCPCLISVLSLSLGSSKREPFTVDEAEGLAVGR